MVLSLATILLVVSLISENSGLSNDILVRLQDLTKRIDDKIDNITRLEEIVTHQTYNISQLGDVVTEQANIIEDLDETVAQQAYNISQLLDVVAEQASVIDEQGTRLHQLETNSSGKTVKKL